MAQFHEAGNIAEKEDPRWFSVQAEVRSRHGDSQVGQMFTDGRCIPAFSSARTVQRCGSSPGKPFGGRI